MNNTKANLKEDMFKSHPVFGAICSNLVKASDEIVNRVDTELADFQVTKVNQGLSREFTNN